MTGSSKNREPNRFVVVRDGVGSCPAHLPEADVARILSIPEGIAINRVVASSSIKSPKIEAPSLNASSIVRAAPATSGCFSCQARTWSSDRKKLIVVQSDVHARRLESRWPIQTIKPVAVGSGPEGSAASVSGSPQSWHRERMSIRWCSIAAMPRASVAQHA